MTLKPLAQLPLALAFLLLAPTVQAQELSSEQRFVMEAAVMRTYHFALAATVALDCPKYLLRMSEGQFSKRTKAELDANGITTQQFNAFLKGNHDRLRQAAYDVEYQLLGVDNSTNLTLCEYGDRMMSGESFARAFLVEAE